jgi:ribonucleoside-diphosphate reductase alpha chain
MANNSMVFTDAATDEQIHDLVTHLSSVGSGEPGIFRRDGNIPLRRSPRVFGTNPCGEIILRSRQFCNLSIAVARQEDTLETLQEKTRLATIFGTIQSCLTSFAYLKTEWKQNSEAERLLGVDITGTMDSPLLQAGNPCLASTLKLLLDTAKETNQKIAQQFGIMPSASITCNKPSGNSSQLIASSSGIHPRYADYYIRRLRISARSPLGKRLVSRGIPCSPEVGQGTMDEARVWVFEFPVQSPTGSVTRHHLSATEQLHYWLQWKRHWTEHNPSCTIYVGRQEWVNVESFLKHHWKDIGGLSFLPKDEHTYALAPYEEISKNDYEQRLHALPRSIDLESVRETIDLTTVAQDYACVGNLCEV